LPSLLPAIPGCSPWLGAGFAEVFTRALVLDEEGAGPQEVNAAPMSRELSYGLFEAGDNPALDSEDVKEVVPKALALGRFPRLALPFLGKGDGAVLDFIP